MHAHMYFKVFSCTEIPQIETSVNSILFNQLTEDKFQSNFLILSKKKQGAYCAILVFSHYLLRLGFGIVFSFNRRTKIQISHPVIIELSKLKLKLT